MPITRYNLPADLEEGLNAHFGRTYAEHPEEWSQVFRSESMKKAVVEDVEHVGFTYAAEKTEGGMYAFDETHEGYKSRYTAKTYGLAFAITEEAIEDQLYEREAPKNASALARAMKQTKEVEGASILNNGFTAGVYAGGDGVALLSSSHPTRTAGNQSNILDTPSDISEEAIEEMVIKINLAKDAAGIPILLQPEKLVVHPNSIFEVHRILKSMGRVGTSDNDTNALKDMGVFGGDSSCVKMRRLTDTDAWFVLTDCPEGLKYMQRTPLQKGTDTDFATGNYLYRVRERFVFGFSNWRHIYGSSGQGS